VNNAGTLSMGMVEEFTEAEARAQLEVNVFGALWVSQAALPHLRRQGSGHLIQMSSVAALAGFPSTGLYSASKFALEGMSEALATEAAPFGVRVTIVQPGGYWTDLYTSMASTTPLDAYAPLRAELEKQHAVPAPGRLTVPDRAGSGRQPPRRSTSARVSGASTPARSAARTTAPPIASVSSGRPASASRSIDDFASGPKRS